MPFQSRDQEEWGDLMNLKPHIYFLVLLGKFYITQPKFWDTTVALFPLHTQQV